MVSKWKTYATGGAGALGISSGALLFVARWLSISMIIFSSELLIQYGMLGLIGFIAVLAIVFFVFSIIGQTIRRRFKQQTSIVAVVQSRTSGASTKLLLLLLLILSVGLLLIQAFSVHLMLETMFQFPIYISQFLFFLCCFLYAGLSGMKSMLRLEPIFVMVTFTAVILIPVYNFIQKGITPVYNGVWLYHPYILFWKNKESMLFVLTAFLLVFSMMMLDRVSWHRLFLLQMRRVRGAISMAGFILATILLAVLSLLLISLSNESFEHAATVLFSLVWQLHTPLLIGLFIAFCLVISLSVVSAEIHSLTLMITNHTMKKSKNNKGKESLVFPILIAGSLSFIFFLLSLFAPHSIVTSFVMYGIVCTSMVIPMLLIIYGKRKLSPIYVYCISVSIACGWGALLMIGPIAGIWTSLIASCVMTLFFVFVPFVYHRLQIKHTPQ